MFFPKGEISAFERIFHIPEDRVHPFEGRVLDRLFPTSNNMRFMNTSCILYCIGEAVPY